ncbi:MAG: hypothetical protein K0Q72_937 [Armatimonadetes bacterium]|jgi:hypothetical protein|nr:hypothetical protein [Armatimonadota bacterium]
MPEDTLRDTQKLLRELGETPQRSGGEDGVAPQRFCGACWAALPTEAVDCPSCGRSLAELEAARLAKVAADQSWTPPGRSDGSAGSAAVGSSAISDYGLTPPPAPTVPEPLAQELRKSRHHFLVAVAIGSAWGGAVMVAAWFTIQNISPRGGGSPIPGIPITVANLPATNTPPEPPPPANGPEVEAPVRVETKPESRVTWQNPYPELRLELFSASGSRVARQGDDVRLSPGTYQVRIYPKDGNWHIKGSRVRAQEGAQVEVAVTPADGARFFVGLGDRFAEANKTADAISAWEHALEVDRGHLNAHLRLGTALPLQHRYLDARQHLDAVLAADPGNKEALEGKQLLEALHHLEKDN